MRRSSSTWYATGSSPTTVQEKTLDWVSGSPWTMRPATTSSIVIGVPSDQVQPSRIVTM
jgi:hypothetical protein